MRASVWELLSFDIKKKETIVLGALAVRVSSFMYLIFNTQYLYHIKDQCCGLWVSKFNPHGYRKLLILNEKSKGLLRIENIE